ncbi:MAG TPA: zinc ribbon domain-containing protein [Candidatus Fraserbacteria bacterium]|nr:zinc ribbon domain-containing protein [Candidatus Fraserbacteria bacterium]
MHMMIGGMGVLVIAVLLLAALLGLTAALPYIKAMIGAVLGGAALGLGLAFVVAWRQEKARPARPGVPGSKAAARSRCSHCGQLVAPQAALCPNCHQDLKTNCPQCGAIISVTAKSCPRCQAAL